MSYFDVENGDQENFAGVFAHCLVAMPGVKDSADAVIFPDHWGVTVTASTADGPTTLSTTDGTSTWTQTITYDSNGWPSTGAWVKS